MYMYFDNEPEWIRACAALVREGVTFDARTPATGPHHCWVIQLTGGF